MVASGTGSARYDTLASSTHVRAFHRDARRRSAPDLDAPTETTRDERLVRPGRRGAPPLHGELDDATAGRIGGDPRGRPRGQRRRAPSSPIDLLPRIELLEELFHGRSSLGTGESAVL